MIYVLSQDKINIVPLNKPAFITSIYGENSYCIRTDTFSIGAYKNKERALEVLKELADEIACGCFIYEMPDK